MKNADQDNIPGFAMDTERLTSAGVWSYLFLGFFTMAGCEVSTLTTSTFPNLHAKCNGVSNHCSGKKGKIHMQLERL